MSRAKPAENAIVWRLPRWTSCSSTATSSRRRRELSVPPLGQKEQIRIITILLTTGRKGVKYAIGGSLFDADFYSPRWVPFTCRFPTAFPYYIRCHDALAWT
jgi:hypothetical protein